MIECVPNVSEGRDEATIAAMVDVVVRRGCRVLDVHSDADHHRSVLTFVGGEDEVAAAAMSLAELAVERIDLRSHRGVHPRMGAIDVVPFVPVADVTLTDCVRVAREVGRTIAERLEVPVFLYEHAAASERRRNLALIRRGQFEGLSEKLSRPDWAPDYGPARPHPTAGVTAVGARRFLVAFNVVLDTEDLSIARGIATAIRERDGGLPAVKALGLSLTIRGRAQVSMNLTDIERTDVGTAFRRIEEEAASRGVGIVESEVVGLVPWAAVAGTTAEQLRLPCRLSAVVLEERLASR